MPTLLKIKIIQTVSKISKDEKRGEGETEIGEICSLGYLHINIVFRDRDRPVR